MKRKKIFILGGSGLLGSHCVDVLKDSNEILATWKTKPLVAEHSFKFGVNNSQHDLAYLFELYRPDVVINAIGYVTVDGCEKNKSVAQSINVDFVRNIVECLEIARLSSTHLIQISSDSVYGDRLAEIEKNLAWSEQDEPLPLSTYAKTKLASEKVALEHLGPVSVIRTAFYGLSETAQQNLLFWIIDNALKGNIIDGWENIYFSPISASSLAGCIESLINERITGVYNVGSVDACNKYDFVESVCANLSLPVNIRRTHHQPATGKAIRPEFSVLDCRKLSSVIDWSPSWASDLAGYLAKTIGKHNLWGDIKHEVFSD